MPMPKSRKDPLYRAALIGVPVLALAPSALSVADAPAGFWLHTLALLLLSAAFFALLFDKFKPERAKSLGAAVWLGGFGLYFYLHSGADWSLFGEQFLNHEKMRGRYGIFVAPLLLVAKISVWSCISATLIGLALAALRSTGNLFVVAFVTAYVVFFRAIPSIVLVVLVYFALPYLGITLLSTTSVIVALSMMFGAYTTEIFRSGIESVHRIQIEAAKSVGLTGGQALRYVVLPQALRVVIPPLTGVLIDVLKTTSIAYVVGVPELIARARQMEGVIGSVTPLMFVTFLYFIIVLPLVIVSSRLEKRSRRWSTAKAL
jgi:polar amino acid transport system permease protein